MEQLQLRDVPERITFPDAELSVLEHWRHIDAFHTSNKLSEGRPVYSFYDGPPFATGLPHYGHLLAGTIKDTVTRFAYQTGHHVPRRFGWDCHGLPIEFEIEKQLAIKSKQEVLQFGIDKYNAECRNIVMRYANEWQIVVNRLGRWIDFENDYKTLDTSFMESIWYVFKTLYQKNLVYKGFKVMPYSTGCTTPLSNFEAGLNYKNVDDPAVTVSFPIIHSDIPASFLAWTTTPWTLPSNLALCVHPQFDYVYVRDEKSSQVYVLAESRLVQLYKNPKKKKGFEILKKVKGSELVGMRYQPLFDFFVQQMGHRAFRVLQDHYVTDTDGTGIVHQAPAFGEDDHRVCISNGVVDADAHLPCPVDADGNFTAPATDFEGMYIKDADKKIVAALKEAGRLVKNESVNHRYPFCWRSDTPLMQRAVPSWFVRVTDIRDKLVANNKKTYWVPGFVQHNRFGSWLENARDWNVSRNRYWGTPLPIWTNDETGERIVVGSIEELEQLSGRSDITDIHREHVDDIEIKSAKTGAMLRRVPEVFDCWFESGSMPYSAQHYPFESDSEETFTKSFPADFVAEGLDQTRGWFYTLMVLATALYDKPAFKNCVVNGLVLAEDGKKMSKRLKNYPDPNHVFDSYGADALRLYLINSPVVRAEPLRFREDGVRDVVKDVMLPWFNALRFLLQNVRALSMSCNTLVTIEDASKYSAHKNQMDHWIESALGSLTESVHQEMGAYRLYTVVPKLLSFVDSLTDWYVRLNRPRLKGMGTMEEQRAALGTLAHVLLSLSRLMAPFAPFFAEYTYQILKPLAPAELDMDSVHFLMLPSVDKTAVDKQFEDAIEHMKAAIVLGRLAREHREIPLKQPLREATMVHRDQKILDAIKSLEGYVTSELNIRTLHYSTEESEYVALKADADGRVLGKKLGKSFKEVFKAVKALSAEEVSRFEDEGEMEIAGHLLTTSDVKITRELREGFRAGGELQVEAQSNGLLLVLNTVRDDDLRQEGVAREIINRIQKLRKKVQLRPEDQIEVFVDCADESILNVMSNKVAVFQDLRGSTAPLPIFERSSMSVVIADEAVEPIGNANLRVCLTNGSLCPSAGRIADVLGGDVKAAQAVAKYIRCRQVHALAGSEDVGPDQSISISMMVDGKAIECELALGTHIFETTAQRVAAHAPQ
ncbi:Isoleucine--tRNA ligase, cytoplasmic [Gracilariopsis chorda]|uniref:isoleucine--tRNA ligase n=1 Tax=Gracilariopsis chorda TaxID=448386 RepID=A0A2V3IQU3_9FLOR|nr:Isoleucine--tRNA ligase, cytoplasmic [Gracilariopsis chorda]|eukprot:PXF43520.1 Isoleucine--tRNA ligase, cytoplasmic [Gracilariopsis chorda]